MLRFFLAALFLLGSGRTVAATSDVEEHFQFLLTYPRSGTHLMCGYVQALTNKPVDWFTYGKKKFFREHRINEFNSQDIVLYKEHWAYNLNSMNKNGNKLLFLLRNYKESIPRSKTKAIHGTEDLLNQFFGAHSAIERYMKNIKIYDEWDPDCRLLIYYEDLIVNPMEELTKVLQFLNEPIPIYFTQEFLEEARLKSLELYEFQHQGTGGSHSKGEDLEYHSKKIPFEALEKIDLLITTQYSDFWEKYLKRYTTK